MGKSGGFADQSIAKTYRRLRLLVSLALFLLPLTTAASAFFLGGHHLQPSLSDYYFVARDGGLPRTIFLVFLTFLGCVLLAYRGLDDKDNLIHNTAGAFAFGVALFPMHCDPAEHSYCVPGILPALHLPSAGLLYVGAVVSVLYGGGPRLRMALEKLPAPQAWIRRLNSIRYASIALMTVGIVGFFVHALAPAFLTGFSWIFWIEYTKFFGFGLYWLRLMLLINHANKAGAGGPPQSTRSFEGTRDAAANRAPGGSANGPSSEAWENIP